MSLESVRDLIPLPDEDMVPPPELFLHPSYLHGQAHVARVMVHALRLIEATGAEEGSAAPLGCRVLTTSPAGTTGAASTMAPMRGHAGQPAGRAGALSQRVGVGPDDHPAIEAAVTRHCNGEPSRGEPHYRLMALLKDADGLDRVRLGDLRPEWLRHDAARTMVDVRTAAVRRDVPQLKPGPDYFGRLWPEVGRILADATLIWIGR